MLGILLLACDDNIGVRGPGALVGEECADQETCAEPLICSHDGTCQQEGSPGTTGEWGDCLDSSACSWGLVCSSEAQCVQPGEAGTAGVDEACDSDADCALGLACEDGSCVDLELPEWDGVSCEAVEGDFRVLFEVPDLPASSELEFYRLPYPNDARLDGTVDLSGHPWPPDLEAVRELVEQQKGFPISPTVTFRLSEELDPGTLDAEMGDGGTVWFASIDEDAPDYGLVEDFELDWHAGVSRWACGDRLAVRPDPGRPLRPGQPYAVWISKGLRSAEGESVGRDADFEVLMGEERPGGDGDLRLVQAWEDYAPFRLFLARGGFDESRVVGAAVFTVGDAGATSRSASYLVEQAGVSTEMADLDLCDAEACTPCLGLSGATELVGSLELPLFSGRFTQSEGSEAACVHISLPTGDAPAGGFPLAILSQETGLELGESAAVYAEALAEQGIASVSLELPNHGSRGRQDQAFAALPEVQAFQDDRMQAGFELQQLMLALEDLELSLDLDRVHLIGNGSGGETALGFATAYGQLETLSLGGVGGNTHERLVHVLSSSELRQMLQDPTVDAWHPGVAMLHAAVEPVDPQIHARELWKEPRGIFTGTHLLHQYLADERELGDEAQAAWQLAASLPTAGEVLDDFGQSTTDLPVQDNVLDAEGERHTVASVQLAGDASALPGNSAQVVGFVSSSGEDAPVID